MLKASYDSVKNNTRNYQKIEYINQQETDQKRKGNRRQTKIILKFLQQNFSFVTNQAVRLFYFLFAHVQCRSDFWSYMFFGPIFLKMASSNFFFNDANLVINN